MGIALLLAAPARLELLAQSRPRVTENRTVSDAGPVGRVPDFQKVTASLGRQGPAKSGARECAVHKSSGRLPSASCVTSLRCLCEPFRGPWGDPDCPACLEGKVLARSYMVSRELSQDSSPGLSFCRPPPGAE